MYNFIQILKLCSATKPISAESDQTTHTLIADNHKMEDILIHVIWVDNYFYIHSVKSSLSCEGAMLKNRPVC